MNYCECANKCVPLQPESCETAAGQQTKNKMDYLDEFYDVEHTLSPADLAFYLMEDEGMTVNEALGTVYDSEYYNLLNNLDTELYLRGSLNNYHYLRRELDYGKP